MQSNLKFSILHSKRIGPQKFWEYLNTFYMRLPEKVSYWLTLVCAVPC